MTAEPGSLEKTTPGFVGRLHGWARLAAALLGVAGVWLLLLPWIAAQPRVEQHLQWLDEQRIDPSAMYYTELECMKPLLDRLNRQERQPASDDSAP